MVKTWGSQISGPKSQGISSGPRTRPSYSKSTVFDNIQHSTAYTSNQKRHMIIKENLVNKIWTFLETVKKRSVQGDVTTKHCRILLHLKIMEVCRHCLGTDTLRAFVVWRWKCVLKSGRGAPVSRKNHCYFCSGQNKNDICQGHYSFKCGWDEEVIRMSL